MGYWNSRGLRGSALEDLINATNESYKAKNLAIVQKIPTPITPVSLNKEKGIIDVAYFEKKSTVDYIGVVQGIPICFDAKETSRNILPLQNIHAHQVDFMECFEKQKGLSFFIVSFTSHNEYYFLPFKQLKKYWDNAQSGGRKSIPYADFQKKYRFGSKNGFFVHYLDPISLYLESSEEE